MGWDGMGWDRLQRRRVSVLEPHEKTLLDDSELVGPLPKLLLRRRQLVAAAQVLVDERKVLLQRQRLRVCHRVGAAALLAARDPRRSMQRVEPAGRTRGGDIGGQSWR